MSHPNFLFENVLEIQIPYSHEQKIGFVQNWEYHDCWQIAANTSLLKTWLVQGVIIDLETFQNFSYVRKNVEYSNIVGL